MHHYLYFKIKNRLSADTSVSLFLKKCNDMTRPYITFLKIFFLHIPNMKDSYSWLYKGLEEYFFFYFNGTRLRNVLGTTWMASCQRQKFTVNANMPYGSVRAIAFDLFFPRYYLLFVLFTSFMMLLAAALVLFDGVFIFFIFYGH